MAISSATITRSSVLSGMNTSSSYCATCGKASAATTKAYSGSYSGRGDSYVCATCNKGSSSSLTNNTSSTYSRSTTSGNSSSSYCPNCNKTHSTTAHWTGGNTSSSSTTSSAAGTVSWAR